MKNKVLFTVIFVCMFFVFGNDVFAATYSCSGKADCESRCKDKKYTSQVALGVTVFSCTNGYASGAVKIGESCESQSDCVSGAYCNKSGLNKCVAKKAPGAECGQSGTSESNCTDECQSGKFQKVTVPCPTGQSMCAPRETKKCADASGQIPKTTPTPKDGQFYQKEADCKTNCTGGTCTFVSGTSMYRCDLKSGNSGTDGSGSGSGSGGTNSTASIKIENPLKFNTVEEFINVVLTRARQIIVILSLVFILIGAVMYVASAGNPDMTGKAKGAITAALIGLAIGIAAPSFLKEIGGILGWNGADNSEVSSALSLSQIATNVLNFLLGIFGVLSMIMLVIGGLTYVTAAGSEDRIDKGKKIFTYALIGIVVAMSALVIVKQIAKFFV